VIGALCVPHNKMYMKYIESELENPRQIKRLCLHCADLVTLPKEIGQFVNLEYLELSFNNFETLPEIVSCLGKLKRLHIRNNKLIELNDSLANLRSLKMIHMPCNLALNSDKAFKQLSKLPKLEKLSLGRCAIANIDPSIGEFSSLRVLYLYDNHITDLPDEIYDLKKLQILDLSNNPIDINEFKDKFKSKGLRFE
jgi:Leucine-rich repeat (LRR) protein